MKWLVVPALLLGTLVGSAVSGLRTAKAVALASLAMPKVAQIDVMASNPSATLTVTSEWPGNPAVLDARRQLALGMIETGNRDGEIGGAGEVSRYQIMPSVWKQYSQSRAYQNPAVSLAVARQHWARLYAGFQKQAHRNPTDFDMYVLWNTRYGYYAGRGFNPGRLDNVVRDRAQRFVNLVQYAEL